MNRSTTTSMAAEIHLNLVSIVQVTLYQSLHVC